jgi:hypothetical protein
MKVLWHLLKKIESFVLWDEGMRLKWYTFHIFSIFFTTFFFVFFPLPTYKPKPNEPLSNIHSHQYWRVMEGKPKTSSWINESLHMYKMFHKVRLQKWIPRFIFRLATICCYVCFILMRKRICH